MELKKILDKLKTSKTKSSLLELSYEILKLEELLIENADFSKNITQLGDVMYQIFLCLIDNRVDINSTTNPDLDLDHWKNNIKKYRLKNKVSNDIYLYTIRNTLKNLIRASQDNSEYYVKVHLFELMIKTFLYVDYVDLSIDAILESKLKTIKSAPVEKVEKKEEIKENIV